MKHTRHIAAALLTVTVLSGATACSKYNDERGKGDAPVAGRHGDDSPAAVTNFPDGFSNIATKCVAGVPGYRAFVTTHSAKAAPAVTILVDRACKG